MSGNGAGSGRGSNGGGGAVSTKKMLQNIKEILGGSNACSEDEIYAMLKECNMDPSETVHRLLNQDTFHEVKSKREKKKETKESTDLRSRGASNSSNRGGRGGADRPGLTGSNRASSSEYGGSRGKPGIKKENGSSSLMPGSAMAGNSIMKSSTAPNDSVSMESAVLVATTAGSIDSQPLTEVQQAWSGVAGQVTLADIVRMGRPPGKPSRAPASTLESYTPHNAVAPSSLHLNSKHSTSATPPSELLHEVYSSQEPVSEVLEIVHESGVAVGQHVSHDEWSLDDNLTAGSVSSVLEVPGTSDIYVNPSAPSNLHVDEVNLHQHSRVAEVGGIEGNVDDSTLAEDSVRTMTASYRQLQVDNPGDENGLDDGSFKNMNSYQSQVHSFAHHEVENANVEVSTAVSSMQQVSLHEGVLGAISPDDNPAVIIPNHLQVTNADCSHLSFGSFGSGTSATLSGSFASKTLEGNSEVASITADATSVDCSDARNPEYYSSEQLMSTSNINEASRMSTTSGSYETPPPPPSSSQHDVLRADSTDVSHGLQFTFPSSMPGYTFSNTAQPSTTSHSYAQGNSQMQNLAPLSSVMQAYSSSLPSNLLASTVQPGRQFDLPYAPLLATQSMPTRYSTAMSSISGPTISMPEALKPGGVFSTLQPAPQNLTTTSMALPPTVSPNLPIHAYSQPTLPFANMMYPFLPQSYAYMPSAAFQQTYTGNSAYPQSPAAVHSAGIKYTLPQYKHSVSLSSLLQSAAVPPGYGAFGSSTNIPGSFPLNPSSASASSVIGREDMLSAQYKEGNHYPHHQQNESSPMWIHGDSRTMSALPASTYYSLQGQNQNSGFRQVQQPSHYGALGYPNLYHSQAGASQEHHQSPSDGNLNVSQPPTAQTSHQMWQQSY